MTGLRHGTIAGGRFGCSCAECRAAHERELATSRALKESYRGQCEKCGRRTTGCNGPCHAPKLCYRCSPVEVGRRQRGTGPVTSVALAFFEKERRFSDLRDHLGISNGHTGMLINRLLRYGLIERTRRGYYRALPREELTA